VIEDKIIERVGDSQSVPVDVRIISATNRNLTKLVDEGAIRKDFYFRINVIPINLPPLRERLEDIPLLAEFFFRKNQLKSGKNIQGITNDTMDALVNYWWPGNVRELKGAFEYAFVTCQETMIKPRHLPLNIIHKNKSPGINRQPSLNREEIKKIELIETLKQTNGNQSEAARVLGVTRVTIWNRMKRFGIHPDLKNSI
jgi:transcriptional regulator with PAS, ATPase and Fis domain